MKTDEEHRIFDLSTRKPEKKQEKPRNKSFIQSEYKMKKGTRAPSCVPFYFGRTKKAGGETPPAFITPAHLKA
ncbi:hypothetical protein KHA93_15310 [Bacillus sp. FJAT-49732]|uniref:Uncharacterized protein n=1 Tax=Lederbergia citrisecunda TaxID=2833583 RepID=A0A942YMS3_9BACI|nr:hypothetical protein [Lederbergia citrisecunda]MBS4201005.1 hypothetical protein [Lederbergia citrisecunda]